MENTTLTAKFTDDYLRPFQSEGSSLVLVGGADHKTGHEAEPQGRYTQLADYARTRFSSAVATKLWAAQFYEPADGLPYIGRAPLAERVFIATGFSGVGLVQGTMAAIDLAALLRGEVRDTPWKATRLALAAAPRLIAETFDMATCWVGDRLAALNGNGSVELAPGEGRILRLDGHRRAVYRDEQNFLHVMSPVCTHLGCLVRWNGSARTWDCPCHGARYAPTGEVLEGPALRPLKRFTQQSAPNAEPPPTVANADVQRMDTDKG